MPTRTDVVRVARSYIDTPHVHLGRKPGMEIDCAGLVICVMRELGLSASDFEVEPYIQVPDGKSMIAMLDKHLTRIKRDEMQPGDVVCLITDKYPQHLGILGDYIHGGLSLIHAANVATPGRVIETRLMFARNCRLVACHAIPGVT